MKLPDKSDSIFESIKHMLGPAFEDETFDLDIMVHINTSLSYLTQIGVGPQRGFSILDGTETWQDFVTEIDRFPSVITYVYLKAKLLFDPPASSSIMSAYQEEIKEATWRLNHQSEMDDLDRADCACML